jgi:hypothetical protein
MVPTQSSEETTGMLCTEQRRLWYVSGKRSPRIAGIVLTHLLAPEGVEGGQARVGIELTNDVSFTWDFRWHGRIVQAG